MLGVRPQLSRVQTEETHRPAEHRPGECLEGVRGGHRGCGEWVHELAEDDQQLQDSEAADLPGQATDQRGHGESSESLAPADSLSL